MADLPQLLLAQLVLVWDFFLNKVTAVTGDLILSSEFCLVYCKCDYLVIFLFNFTQMFILEIRVI